MTLEIKTFDLGANAYLVATELGYVLIDTGLSNKRNDLEKGLIAAGCKPGYLKLIVLTHGDTDHAGNCVYLHEKYGAPIVMHRDESNVIESGEMLSSRKNPPLLAKLLFPFFRLNASARFKPGLFIEDGASLVAYGFDAQVLHLPGHTQGSIGILTSDGVLFCGDLLINTSGKPSTRFIDDWAAFDSSIEKLKGYQIATVYPGHGKPFRLETYLQNYPKPVR